MVGFWGSICPSIIIVIIGFADVEVQSTRLSDVDATILDVPWHAALWESNIFVGDGAIISKEHILTSARLVYQYTNTTNLESIFVMVGENQTNSGIREVHEVHSIMIHPDYEHRFPYPNDLALLRLKEAIQFTDTKQPVQLPYIEFPSSGLTTISESKTRDSEILGHFKIYLTRIEDNAKCESLLKLHHSYEPLLSTAKLLETQVCTVAAPDTNCLRRGNVGSPLVLGRYLLGIKSWDVSCFSGDPIVYSRIDYYEDWIYQTICNPRSNCA